MYFMSLDQLLKCQFTAHTIYSYTILNSQILERVELLYQMTIKIMELLLMVKSLISSLVSLDILTPIPFTKINLHKLITKNQTKMEFNKILI